MCLGIAARKFLPTDVHEWSWATQLLHPPGQEGQRQPTDAEQYFGSPAAGFEEAVGVQERKSMTVAEAIWQHLKS